MALAKEKFYWPKLEKYANKHIQRYRICHLEKTQSQNTRLYMPLPVPKAPWEDVCMNFVLGLTRTQQHRDSVMVVVDRFSNMDHFIPCQKTYDVFQVADIYFKEIVPSSRNSKNCHFWLRCEVLIPLLENSMEKHGN